jgi:hypothetical protein
MRRLIYGSTFAVALALLVPSVQGSPMQGDPDRVVPGGGIHVQGWKGRIAPSDTSSLTQGRKIEDSKFSQTGNVIRVETGPAGLYWNPANTATGNYTVKATFTEAKYQEFNSHPHSYGIFIGGNKLDTDQLSLVYCVAYGNGTALVRGMSGATPFTLMRDRQPNAAVNKAADKLQPVTNEIAWTVKDGRGECMINGKSIAAYDKAALVGAGKLESTDGIVGIRTTHNVDFTVTGWTITKQ